MCFPPISWKVRKRLPPDMPFLPRPNGRWLIDLEGLRDVDICNAYADAQSTSYPGTAYSEPFLRAYRGLYGAWDLGEDFGGCSPFFTAIVLIMNHPEISDFHIPVSFPVKSRAFSRNCLTSAGEIRLSWHIWDSTRLDGWIHRNFRFAGSHGPTWPGSGTSLIAASAPW